jgi:quinol monooxygenase YgiN
MYTTSIDAEPNKLVFFEIFLSQEAHDWQMAQDYNRVRRHAPQEASHLIVLN